MLYISINRLKPGMVLAQDVAYGFSMFSLLVAGQILTQETIDKLGKYKVQGVYIKSSLCSDVTPAECIPSEYKQKTLTEIKRVFDDYTTKKIIGDNILKSIQRMSESMIMQILSNDECLFQILEIKSYDTYTYTHSMYVGMLSVMIGIQKGYPYTVLKDLAICGLLHDIGKVDIPHDIICKNAKLTEEEFDTIKQHPQNAVNRLSGSKMISQPILSGILSHHEKWDGTGYPSGLKGKQIPIYGRILALADVYDALTSERSYRKALSSSEAIEYMMGCADTHFDYDLLQVFLKTVAAYPVGTLINLSNGQLAIVTQNSQDSILRPKVKVLMPKEFTGIEIDLANDVGYLNVTIQSVLDENTELPEELYT